MLSFCIKIFLALCNGASLLTVASTVKRSPWDLANVLFLRNRATILQITPSLFHSLPEEVIATKLLGDTSQVRVLAFGGERFPPLGLLAKYKTQLVRCGRVQSTFPLLIFATSRYFRIKR